MGFAKVRLFVDQPLGPGQPVALSDGQAHYLVSVMRLGPGAQVLVFNGRDGEWRATLDQAGRRQAVLVAEEATAPLRLPPDLWLVFAPLKKARTDFIVEKATELGAARILPVQTRFTSADRIRQDRLQAHAIEAAEQCGGTFVPVVEDLQPLDRLLDGWPDGRRLMWCDEHLAGRSSALTGVIAGCHDDAR
ncbi:MAG: 16S rRNA (uracil(1498)-N(3))-methyltransferase, partial [Gemmobacter sp.]